MDRFLIKLNKKGSEELEEHTSSVEESASQVNKEPHEIDLEEPVSKKNVKILNF